jgi:hypothetical protein
MDSAKRNVRASTLDLILDLVPAGDAPVSQHRPVPDEDTPETALLLEVADAFLRVGNLTPGWHLDFQARVRRTAFLSAE